MAKDRRLVSPQKPKISLFHEPLKTEIFSFLKERAIHSKKKKNEKKKKKTKKKGKENREDEAIPNPEHHPNETL